MTRVDDFRERAARRVCSRDIAGRDGTRPDLARRLALPQVVSLFSGAGGLDLGFKKAGYKIAVAIDAADAAIRTHSKNFPWTKATVANLVTLQPKGVVECVQAALSDGQRIAVIGGPPCQGFSRANTSSQADDPRNKLPKLYLDIVRALQQIYTVEFIVFENVLGIRDKKHAETYKDLKDGIADLGFVLTEKELCAIDFGVPQNRRRIVLSGMRGGQGYSSVKPRKRRGVETVREAIGGLKAPAYFKHGLQPKDIPVHPNHWTMQPRSPRFANPDSENREGRSFRRLSWDAESPTIAFGHREIHIHPCGRRRLSIYEAMLLQGFPKKFVLEGNLTEQAQQISDAVPPPLARSVASAVTRALDGR
jgi:DNA (cytosine-5)-methyltransferase 1